MSQCSKDNDNILCLCTGAVVRIKDLKSNQIEGYLEFKFFSLFPFDFRAT